LAAATLDNPHSGREQGGEEGRENVGTKEQVQGTHGRGKGETACSYRGCRVERGGGREGNRAMRRGPGRFPGNRRQALRGPAFGGRAVSGSRCVDQGPFSLLGRGKNGFLGVFLPMASSMLKGLERDRGRRFAGARLAP